MGHRWRWLLDVERAQLHGKARGQIELWPFTETLIDLLGPRYTGKAVMEAHWTRVHSGLETTWRRRIVARFGVSWYRVLPQAHLDTWRPAVLVFGRADEKRTLLSVTELQLAALSMGWQFGVAGFDLDFAVRQFVPIHWEKAASSALGSPPVPSTPAEETPASATSQGWKWPGGTFLRFGVMRRF